MQTILLIEDRENLRQLYANFLRKQDYTVLEAGSVEEAKRLLEKNAFGLVITDYMLPGENGLALLKELKAGDPDQTVVVMTAFGEIKLAVEAMKAGASDFLEKPVDLEYLRMVVAKAFDHQRLRKRQILEQAQQDQPDLVAVSAQLQEVLGLGDRVAKSNATCLLTGESGVGKELFAKRIHQQSARAGAPMVSVNCAAIPRDLIESELFGHEKGAFTGAIAKKVGLIEMAEGGTLFLDEIGELPLDLQPKLLRAIQTGEFRRVGGGKILKSDTRLVCATNRDLVQGIANGWFREDLYYRIAVFPIQIPPLRDRKDDIVPIAEQILIRARYQTLPLSPEVIALLQAYHWPGNVRELKNVLERAVILSGGDGLKMEHFPSDLIDGRCDVRITLGLNLEASLKENLAHAEAQVTKAMIEKLMAKHEGHKGKVAGALGVSPKTLYNKMKPE